MKKMTILKSIATVGLLTVFGMNTLAQVTNAQLITRPTYDAAYYGNAANYTSTGSETATVGAQMPYLVNRDANVNGAMFNASTFVWTFTGITGLVDYTTSGAITSGGADVSYNNVIATMPLTAGTASLKTQEKSNPKFGTGCLDGTGTTLSITVVDKPTFSLTAGSAGGCTTTAQNLVVTLTGTAPFYVDYQISAVGLDGSTVVGSTKTYNATLSAITDKLLIDPTQLSDVAGVATPTAGKYTVKVTKVWDTNSWKAINAASLAVVPTVNTYDIYVYPTPQTQPIQFIKVQ